MLKILACVGIGLLAAFISYLLGTMIGRDKETEQELTDYGGGTYVLNNITHSNYDSDRGFLVNLFVFCITSMAFLKIMFSMKMMLAIGLGAITTIVAFIVFAIIGCVIANKKDKISDIAIIPCCLLTGAMIATIFFQLNLF